MKDHNAPKRIAGGGVTRLDAYPDLIGRTGVPKQHGVASTIGTVSTRVGLLTGTMQGEIKASPKPPKCGGTTKKGLDCGARPVKGESYCVGHLRQNSGSGSN